MVLVRHSSQEVDLSNILCAPNAARRSSMARLNSWRGLSGVVFTAVLSGLALSGLALSDLAWAQDDPLAAIPPQVLSQLRPNVAIEQVVAQALMPIRQLDFDRNGLDDSDIDTAAAVSRAELRANQVSRLLRYDIDGDGSVTEAEVRKVLIYQGGRRASDFGQDDTELRLQKQVTEMLTLDADGNKTVTMTEMLAADPQNERAGRDFDRYRILVKLDPSGDGQLTVEEMESLVRTAFKLIDTDGDGVIERNEFTAQQEMIMQSRQELNMPACTLPKAGDAEQVMAVGMYDGGAQPTVTVSGQNDVTSLARISIEPGAAPIYLVLSSYTPMIWKIEGETKRLVHVAVLVNGRRVDDKGRSWPGAGILGVDKDLVSFMPPDTCGRYFHDANSGEAKILARAIARTVGKPVTKTIGVYYAEGVAVPSGNPVNPKGDQDLVIIGNKTLIISEDSGPEIVEGGLSMKQQENRLGKLAGIVEVDPAAVVAPGKVEAYQVIPGQDGLRLLVSQGILERLKDGYRVLKPLPYWPAGLSGAHSVIFYLPQGMPVPAGSAGHSRIVMEQ